MNTVSNKSLIEECRERLLKAKSELLNHSRRQLEEYRQLDKGSGDEADQSAQSWAEHEFLSAQERVRFQLVEIESALHRIVSGTYGICEETDELIERERLLAIPWTRLSIEGAEIREAMKRRYAR